MLRHRRLRSKGGITSCFGFVDPSLPYCFGASEREGSRRLSRPTSAARSLDLDCYELVTDALPLTLVSRTFMHREA